MAIPIVDGVLREINIIKTIFQCQFLIHNQSEDFPCLEILDCDSNLISGRYIENINLISNVEFVNTYEFKNKITERWEGANDKTLLKNQLNEIYNDACLTVKYYNEKLTDKNVSVKEYNEKRKFLWLNQNFQENRKLLERHEAVVTVYDYHIGQIYLGCTTAKLEISHDFNFRYHITNFDLASKCQVIINFINKLGFKTVIETSNPMKSLSAYEIALRHWYLVEAKVEPLINALQVGEKYGQLKNWKNIQSEYLKITVKSRSRPPKKIELQKVLNALSDFPEVQKAVTNDIDRIE